MSYTLATLWHDRQRYLPGVLAVGFSALLINLQCGLLLGLISITSLPVDRSHADLWVTAPEVLSVDLGRPIPERFLSHVAGQPEVEKAEIYLQGFAYWSKPHGGSELCMVIGARLQDDALGILDGLPTELWKELTEPDVIAINRSDLQRLGVQGIGDLAEISHRRVRVVGITQGMKSFAGPLVFCSVRTARSLLRLGPEQTIFILGRCSNREAADMVVRRLRHEEDITAFTNGEFSWRTRMHWLTTTKGGIAMGYAAVLGLLVGAVVTSQTLYSATAASFREYATLEALGIPRWRISLLIVCQAFWIGVIGVVVALPCMFVAARVALWLGVQILVPLWLLASGTAVTLLMAMLSGLVALRSLRQINMMSLLR